MKQKKNGNLDGLFFLTKGYNELIVCLCELGICVLQLALGLKEKVEENDCRDLFLDRCRWRRKLRRQIRYFCLILFRSFVQRFILVLQFSNFILFRIHILFQSFDFFLQFLGFFVPFFFLILQFQKVLILFFLPLTLPIDSVPAYRSSPSPWPRALWAPPLSSLVIPTLRFSLSTKIKPSQQTNEKFVVLLCLLTKLIIYRWLAIKDNLWSYK